MPYSVFFLDRYTMPARMVRIGTQKEGKSMNQSEMFKAAHKLAKAHHVKGENYNVTFGQALRIVRKAQTVERVSFKPDIMGAFITVMLCFMLLVIAVPTLGVFGAIVAGKIGAVIGMVGMLSFVIWLMTEEIKLDFGV